MRGVGGLFGIAGALCASASSAQVPARYLVYPVRATIADDTVVGPLKRGFACVKAGSLRWAAFTVRGDAAAEGVAAALVAAGVDAQANDPSFDGQAAGPARRLTVEITALEADTCRPRYGMLKLGSIGLKGHGAMSVRWRLRDKAGAILRDETTSADFSFSAAGDTLGAIVTVGLLANTRTIAPRLSR